MPPSLQQMMREAGIARTISTRLAKRPSASLGIQGTFRTIVENDDGEASSDGVTHPFDS